MGDTELKAALRRESEAQARQLWAAAEEELAERCAEVSAEIRRLDEDARKRLAEDIATLRNDVLQDAQRRASGCRLQVEAALSERLRQLTDERLNGLSAEVRARLWPALRAELPETEWQHVSVHPEDRERAREAFPDAEIEVDPEIAAGMRVATGDRKIMVDNTLNSRCARAWPDLLPELLAELRRMVDADEASGTDTSGGTAG